MDPRRLYWYYVQVIRSKIRSYMTPMTIDEAQEKRELLAKLYCTAAFFTLVYGTYRAATEKTNFNYGTNNPTPVDVINKLNVKGDVKVLSFEGFKKVDEYIYNRDRPDEIRRTSKPAEEEPELLVG